MIRHFHRNVKSGKSISAIVSASALVLMAATATTSASASVLTPYKADYTFSIEGKYNGTAQRTLSKSGKNYRYLFSASVPVVANATQDTTFAYQAGGTQNFLPLKHQTKYKIFVMSRNTDLNFDYKNKKLYTKHRGKAKTYALNGAALDELTLEMQIRKDLSEGKLQKSYKIASRKGVRDIPFINEGKTKITVPAGTFDVIKVRRVHNNDKRKSFFWLAPKLDYLPVRVMQNDKGKVYDFKLKKLY